MMSYGMVKLLFGACLLMAAEALSLDCYARPNDQADTKQAPQTTGKKTVEPTDLRDTVIDHPNGLGRPLLRNLASDQKAIWSSPSRVRWADGSWLFPVAVVTGGLLATDRSAVRPLSNNPSTLNRFRKMSDYGLASLMGTTGGLYLWSKLSPDDHRRETGVLAGEAAINGLAVNSLLQYSFGRERPDQGNGHGRFLQGGSSFPSDHAVIAWSAASVIAHEYPGPITRFLVYGMAAGISASRVMGREHFPSDVFVGSTMGWLIGRQVYRAHHDPDLGGTTVSSLSGKDDGEDARDRQHMGSSFVPLDSWVYAAFERLAALGYVKTAIMGLKPWTRMECARLTDEAGEALREGEATNPVADQLQARLQEEFAYELDRLGGGHNLTARLESLYARAVSISGPALTDGYHFGQTLGYDFGRPFQRGTNGQAGGSFSAAAGPLAVYIRAEFQHAPSAPAPSNAVLTTIAHLDRIPLSKVASGSVTTTNRPRLLDAYAAVNLSNWQLALGRQSLSWTAVPGGSMLWSNNIEPVNMVRVVNAEPLELPGFLRHAGPLRIDQFVGQLSGHTYIPRPFIYGQKVNVKPFPFLELGFGRTVTLGGSGGDPITTGNFARSFFGRPAPDRSVPGDNHAAFDWTFYVPGVRNYVVLYGDAYADDDGLPLQNPAKNPWHPGIYITRVPKIPKLDLHVEGVSTEQHNGPNDLNYWNQTYRDGYTNNGFLIGNTVGRYGRTIQGWLTYLLSPRDTLRLGYKHSVVSSDRVPGGGAWQDYWLGNETYLRSGFYVKSQAQYEHISRYPILFDGRQRNFTATVEVGFSPGERAGK